MDAPLLSKRKNEKQITKDDNFDDDDDDNNDSDNGGTWTPASAEVMVNFINNI